MQYVKKNLERLGRGKYTDEIIGNEMQGIWQKSYEMEPHNQRGSENTVEDRSYLYFPFYGAIGLRGSHINRFTLTPNTAPPPPLQNPSCS
jgi:hypothetical protein